MAPAPLAAEAAGSGPGLRRTPLRPTFHPALVNGLFGDPALYVESLHQSRALLLDLGEIPGLPPRKLLRLSDVFVSHTHMDHFAGFDRLLRVCLGREVTLRLWGPEGFTERVAHKLGGYSWNLVESYTSDFTLEAAEVPGTGSGARARFRVRSGFTREELSPVEPEGGVLVDDPELRVRAAVLDHRIPCLAFALEEPEHINIWRNRLEAKGLVTGPWLRTLKAAVRRQAHRDTPIPVGWRDPAGKPATLPLGELEAEVLARSRGQKVAYVVDALFSEANRERIVDLARGADRLYIEAAFLERDRERAAATYHLTARQAGLLAREAGVGDLVPFHFSTRYEGEAEVLQAEARAAFRGEG